MDLIEARVLHFRCRFTAPFHTARQEYASLIKTAPFVPGSTLRGAGLTALIERHCPADNVADLRALNGPEPIAEYHRACDQVACPVKPFFASQTQAWFSFGQLGVTDGGYGLTTRIAIARDTRAVAGGAMVSIENIEAGTPFEFDLILAEEAMSVANQMVEAMRRAGEMNGIGRLRSIGYGRFAIEDVTQTGCSEMVDKNYMRMPALDGDVVTLELVSPYVLGRGSAEPTEQLTPEKLGEQVKRDLVATVASATYESSEPLEALPITRADAQLKVDFMGRWSFERGMRENRLVAWPGSQLALTLAARPADLHRQLAIAALFGLGEWSDVGFGRFEVR